MLAGSLYGISVCVFVLLCVWVCVCKVSGCVSVTAGCVFVLLLQYHSWLLGCC